MSLDNLTENINLLKARALSSIDRATQKATSVDDYIVDGIGNSLNSRLAIWLTHHPYIAWLINHPLISFVAGLIVLILTVRLLLTIYNAIANTIDRMWLAILLAVFGLFVIFVAPFLIQGSLDAVIARVAPKIPDEPDFKLTVVFSKP